MEAKSTIHGAENRDSRFQIPDPDPAPTLLRLPALFASHAVHDILLSLSSAPKLPGLSGVVVVAPLRLDKISAQSFRAGVHMLLKPGHRCRERGLDSGSEGVKPRLASS